jgi:hypothetical protein
MRIHEILFHPIDGNIPDPYRDVPQVPPGDDLSKLAQAFTRRGLVKHFWNMNRSEAQPSGPEPPDPETELVPSGTSEPITALWQAEPVEEEPPTGLHRLFPSRDYRQVSGD